MQEKPPEAISPEHYVTLRAAAAAYGQPAFKFTRAAKAGLFPTYTFYNKRKLVLLSEVATAFKAVAK